MSGAKVLAPTRVTGARVEALARFATDLVKYGFASAAALALDYGILLLLHNRFGLPYLIAAAIGFGAGLVLIYALSVRYVFNGRRRLSSGPELLGFLITGVLGLALNEVLMSVFVEQLLFSVAFAKIPTAGFVFLFNFIARRAMLFSSPQTPTRDVRS